MAAGQKRLSVPEMGEYSENESDELSQFLRLVWCKLVSDVLQCCIILGEGKAHTILESTMTKAVKGMDLCLMKMTFICGILLLLSCPLTMTGKLVSLRKLYTPHTYWEASSLPPTATFSRVVE